MDFNNVEINNFESKYLKGGNYTVAVTKVDHGKSANGTGYVAITVSEGTGDTAKTAEQRYYLKEGENFNISAQAILKIVAAANNLDITTDEGKAKAKAMIGSVSGEEELANKIATATVGKNFGIHLDEEVVPAKGDKKAWNKAVFGGGSFAVPISKFSTLSDKVKVKDKSGANTNVKVEVNTTSKADW